ncbi:MAG TPA: hypothetical protein DCP63_06150 [Bacteroidetes bacterium]|nr:hypothetical protein [Bacteroidota bacterium]
MTLRQKHRLIIASSLLTAGTFVGVGQSGYEVLRREVARSSEKQVNVKLEASFGNVTLTKGQKDKIVIVEYRKSAKEKQRLRVSYDISGDQGDLDLEIKESRKFDYDDEASSWREHRTEGSHLEDREWNLKFSDAIPMSYDIELGAGKGDLDFTGLKVKQLKFSSGASSVELRVDEPNPVACDVVTLESGVSKFTAEGLSNLNFRKLKFSGGVGAYKLDFGGKLQQSASVDIEVGLGAVTVYVPREIPTRLISDESWFSTLDVDEYFERTRKKSVYETVNFGSSEKKLTIRIESGLGSVRVRSR